VAKLRQDTFAQKGFFVVIVRLHLRFYPQPFHPYFFPARPHYNEKL